MSDKNCTLVGRTDTRKKYSQTVNLVLTDIVPQTEQVNVIYFGWIHKGDRKNGHSY